MKNAVADPKSVEEIPSAELLSEEPEGELEEAQQIPAFVREIPSSMWSKIEERITLYVDNELHLAETERGEFVRKLARWKQVYGTPRPEGTKNFPIANASNLEIPLAKEMVNTLSAQIIQSTLTAEPQWILEDLADEWHPFTDPIQKFLDIASEKDLQLEKEIIPSIVEMTKLGTTVVETGYHFEEKKYYRYTASGKQVYPKLVTVRDGPRVRRIPLQNFWIRFTENDIQEAPWCGVRLTMSPEEIRRKVNSGKFNEEAALYVLSLEWDEERDEVKEGEEKREKTKPAQKRNFEIFKLHLGFDVDDDGVVEELVVYYHRASRKFLSRRFAPEWHGRRPYSKSGFFPVEDRFYDMGVCEMVEQLQEAVSVKTNQRIDNATLANVKMILKRKFVKNLQPGDPLYSGKIIEVNDIWNDVREFQLSDIYPSTIQEEAVLRQTGDRLVGLNEAAMGAGSPVTRTTATAQLALLQEQQKRIDLSVRSVREMLSEIGFFTLSLYFQFGTNGKAKAWLGKKGEAVEAIFRLPRRVLDLGFAIKAHSPSSTQNMQVKRENNLALFNLMVQLYERILPIAAQMAPDDLPRIVNALVSSAHHFMSEVLASFETPNREEILAGLTVLQRVLPSAQDLGGMDAFEREEERITLLDNIRGLEDLLREAEGASRGSDRVRPVGGERTRFSPQERISGGNHSGPGTRLGSLTDFEPG